MYVPVYLSLVVAVVSMCIDLITGRIDNRWIICGWLAGVVWQVWSAGVFGFFVFLGGAVVPLLLCIWLAFGHMIGGGDVKLFSVLGGLIGIDAILRCILFSFLCGAVLSAAILSISGDLWPRLVKFKTYIQNCVSHKKILSYRDPDDSVGRFHFTVPILMGVLLWAGGF